jgi:adenylate cyclase
MDHSIESKTVVDQLNKILGSDQFAGAFRIKKLLKFLVNETLTGRAHQIKAFTIGMAVFDRESDFDPQGDPIVRINAARLRRHLDAYYENCGHDAEIRIAVPKGTYVPIFHRIQPSPVDQKALDRDACVALLEGESGAGKSALGFSEPVIAVLPFSDLSGDETPAYLLDGLSDELSSLLALFDDIKVIDYFSMVKFRDRSIGIREVGRKVGADFLISGSIKTEKDSLKIRASLSDANSAIQIWTHVFERPLSGQNVADTLSEIVGLIISAVAGDFGVIFRARIGDIGERAHADLTHYEAMFMHRHAQLTGNWAYSPQIKKALEKTLEVDPGYAMGWALLGEMHLDRYAHEYSDSGESLDQGYSFARNAVERDGRCQYAHFVEAYSHVLRRDPDNVIRAAEKVWNLNPNAAYLVGAAAFWVCIAGDFDRGLVNLNRSIKLNPHYPGWFHHAWFLFHLKRGNYPEALAEAERFHMPGFFWSYLDKTVATGLLGRIDAAKVLLDKVKHLHPDFANHPRYYVSSFVMEKELMEKMFEGLKKAGLRAI